MRRAQLYLVRKAWIDWVRSTPRDVPDEFLSRQQELNIKLLQALGVPKWIVDPEVKCLTTATSSLLIKEL